VHSLSHSLGGINPRLHHGTLNAIFLPAVVRFNASAPGVVSERKLERLAQSMGLDASADVADAIAQMSTRLGLPHGLAELGVGEDLFPAIVKGALEDHSHKTNPRDASVEDYLDMLRQSL
jgi:alcohol dehydrogenase class IV